jgi:hypothetical protein
MYLLPQSFFSANSAFGVGLVGMDIADNLSLVTVERIPSNQKWGVKLATVRNLIYGGLARL